jgi:hypothetical protein
MVTKPGTIPVHINRRLGTSSYFCDWPITDLSLLVRLLNRDGARFIDNHTAYNTFEAGSFVIGTQGGYYEIFASVTENAPDAGQWHIPPGARGVTVATGHPEGDES